MLSNLSYEQKLKATGFAVLLLIVLCYIFAFNKTINEYYSYKKYSDTKLIASYPADYLKKLIEENKDIDRDIDQFILDTVNHSKNLISIVSNYCNNYPLQFKEYKPLGIKKDEAPSTLTRSIILEGSFFSCLGLIYELETRQKPGIVSSVEFKSYVDTRTKQTKLTCTLYIQNILPDYEKR